MAHRRLAETEGPEAFPRGPGSYHGNRGPPKRHDERVDLEDAPVPTGYEALYCPLCGGAPDVGKTPVVIYPKSARGEVRYRYPCTKGDGTMDLAIGDLRELHRQIRTSEFGVYLEIMTKVRERLTRDMECATEPKDRIAAGKALHAISREAFEDAGIVDQKQSVVGVETVRYIKGTIVERKLRERVQRRLGVQDAEVVA